MKPKDLPILLLTGYLGSGKTTLVNRILANKRGIRFAVIVNDIGEVNGCICCTLKADLVKQVYELMRTERFDYIVIEASGICEPEPIAQTLCSIPRLGEAYTRHGICRLDCVVTVVDALRLQSEFACGDSLTRKGLDEEDIENLIIQQIEFCNVILLNKASEVAPQELGRIRQIVRTLQPSAEIIECNYADVPLEKLLDTHLFNFERAATSAGWIREIERAATEEEEREAHAHGSHAHHHDEEEHGHEHGEDGHHHHHHHHDHEGGEVEEYGIGTFVYYRRPAFDIHKLDRFIATRWPKNIIRAKGVCYFSHNRDMSYLFEQAGVQKQLTEAGQWYATAPEEDLIQLMKQEPGLLRDWDEKYGDRMQKIVFIGQHLDKEQLARELDECLE